MPFGHERNLSGGAGGEDRLGIMPQSNELIPLIKKDLKLPEKVVSTQQIKRDSKLLRKDDL